MPITMRTLVFLVTVCLTAVPLWVAVEEIDAAWLEFPAVTDPAAAGRMQGGYGDAPTWPLAYSIPPDVPAFSGVDETPVEDDEEEKDDEEEEDEKPLRGLLGGPFSLGPGTTLAATYTGELFTNMRGGISTCRATEYLGLVDMVIETDLEAWGLREGGRFVIHGQHTHGRGLSERYVGDFQILSNIDADDLAQISDYWWERDFLDDRLTVRLGKQDANHDFALTELAADFIQSSYGFHPTIPMPSYPHSAAGAVFFLRPAEHWDLRAGVFDGAADGSTWGFSGTGEVFSIIEAERQWKLADGRWGHVHLSLWYHSGAFDDLATGEEGALKGNWGFHGGVEQFLWRRNGSTDADDSRGLYGFGQYGWARADRNEAQQYFGAGMMYEGLISGRQRDRAGAGVTRVIFSDCLPEQSTETAIEVFYKAWLTDWLAVQPDFQYIARPSGIHRDAFVYGTRLELIF